MLRDTEQSRRSIVGHSIELTFSNRREQYGIRIINDVYDKEKDIGIQSARFLTMNGDCKELALLLKNLKHRDKLEIKVVSYA
jgi:hypothetical protein